MVSVDIAGLGGGGGGEICVDLVFPGSTPGSNGENLIFLSGVGRSEAGRKPSPLTDFFEDSVAELKATKPVFGGVSGGFGGVNSVKVRSAQVLIWVLGILVRDVHRAIACLILPVALYAATNPIWARIPGG